MDQNDRELRYAFEEIKVHCELLSENLKEIGDSFLRLSEKLKDHGIHIKDSASLESYRAIVEALDPLAPLCSEAKINTQGIDKAFDKINAATLKRQGGAPGESNQS